GRALFRPGDARDAADARGGRPQAARAVGGARLSLERSALGANDPPVHDAGAGEDSQPEDDEVDLALRLGVAIVEQADEDEATADDRGDRPRELHEAQPGRA